MNKAVVAGQSILYAPAPITPVQASDMAFMYNVMMTPEQIELWARKHGHLLFNELSGQYYIDFGPFFEAVKHGAPKRLRFKNRQKAEKKKALEIAKNDYQAKKNKSQPEQRIDRHTNKLNRAKTVSLGRINSNWLDALKSGLF